MGSLGAQSVPAGDLMPTTAYCMEPRGKGLAFYKAGVGVLGGPSLISADPVSDPDSGQYKCCSQAAPCGGQQPNGTGTELLSQAEIVNMSTPVSVTSLPGVNASGQTNSPTPRMWKVRHNTTSHRGLSCTFCKKLGGMWLEWTEWGTSTRVVTPTLVWWWSTVGAMMEINETVEGW
jgi:hypothetical protein